MAKTYSWQNQNDPGIPEERRIIVESEDILENRETLFTINKKQIRIDRIKNKINNLQARIPILEAELQEIKTALGIT